MLKQNLQLKLSQKLSPQQIQLMKLIQLPALAFEQRIKEEIIENPALESGKEDTESTEDFDLNDENYEDFDSENIDTEDINIDDYLSDDETPEYRLKANNSSADDDEKSTPIIAQVSFNQNLINQLDTFIITENHYEIAKFIIGSLDEIGYLRRSIDDLVDDIAFSLGVYTNAKEVELILKNYVQHLDPTGIGARNLQECLLLQLKSKTPNQAIELATDIIENQFDAFTKKHYEKLLNKYKVSQEQLKQAIEEIEKLNPKPGGSYSHQRIAEHITPDFTVKVEDGNIELFLNSRNAPELHISKDYQEMLKTYKENSNTNKAQKDAVQFIKQKLDGAKWFIEAIKQRQETLFVTMSAIIDYQRAYFLDGDETSIKPMILKDIADKVGLDISTISRVANSKYVETPYGTKLIKEFFSEAMTNNQGEEVSTIEIKKILQDVIENENKSKPYPDDKLAEILKGKGYPIARRTVAKYREQLDIPVARMRKKI